MSRADEVIEEARKRAETIVGNATREALIRRSLEDSHPDIPQPRSVFFAECRDHEAWLSWPEPHYMRDPRPTVAQYWNEGRRILAAFDWQTLAHAKDAFTHVGPEDTIPKSAEILRTFDVLLTLEGGDGERRPSAEVHVWTELAPHINEGFFRIGYEFPADMLPRDLTPTPHYAPDGRRRLEGWDEPDAIRGFEQDRLKWWSSPGNFRWGYLFTAAGWDAFADFVAAEVGD